MITVRVRGVITHRLGLYFVTTNYPCKMLISTKASNIYDAFK